MDNGIKSIHYFWKKDHKLFVTTTRKIASWKDRKKVVLSKLHGHTQLFLQKAIFSQYKNGMQLHGLIEKSTSTRKTFTTGTLIIRPGTKPGKD